MKKRCKVAVLPTKVVKKIEGLKLSTPQKEKAYKAVGLIMKRCYKKEGSIDLYTTISANYWKKTLGWHYEKIIKPLVLNEVIHRPNGYSTLFKASKKHRINPDLLDEKIEIVTFQDDTGEKDNSYVCKQTRKVLRELHLDFKGAIADVERYIQTKGFLKKVKFDNDIADSKNLPVFMMQEDGRWGKYRFPRDLAIEKARQAGKVLIQDKQKVMIQNIYLFLKNKQVQIRFSYIGALERFRNKEFYSNITETNGRLNSNITTMPSILLKYFTLEGEHLLGLDLKNSQFVFLAAMIENGFFDKYIQEAQKKCFKNAAEHKKEELIDQEIRKEEEEEGKGNKEKNKVVGTHMCANIAENEGGKHGLIRSFTGDLKRFLELAKNGNLYEYIRDKLELGNTDKEAGRAEAKQRMFEIFFSKNAARSVAKTQIKGLFPTLMEMIDLFKKEKGDNQFAVALQKKESEIFIGKILPELFGQGFKVLTKHDSVLCKRSDKDRVEAIMLQILDVELGQYQLKTDYLGVVDDK